MQENNNKEENAKEENATPDENDKRDAEERIPFLGVRRKWGAIAIQIFAHLVLVYSGFVLYEHITLGWQGLKTARAIVQDIAPFIVIAGCIPILIFAEGEALMILYNIVKAQIEARQKSRFLQAEKRGIEIGEARGRAAALQEWAEWFERKKTAEANGATFDEPTPAEKQEREKKEGKK